MSPGSCRVTSKVARPGSIVSTMQLVSGEPVFAATDLVGFLACEHLVGLELAVLAGLVDRPVRSDPELDLVAMRGQEHEARYLADLEGRGLVVARIDVGDHDGPEQERGRRLRAAASATEAAIRRGDQRSGPHAHASRALLEVVIDKIGRAHV